MNPHEQGIVVSSKCQCFLFGNMLIFIFAIPGRGAPSTNSDFLRRQVNYLSVAMRTTYVFFTGVATAQSIINEGEEGTLGLVRFGFSLVAGTKGRRTCAN